MKKTKKTLKNKKKKEKERKSHRACELVPAALKCTACFPVTPNLQKAT